MQEIEPTRDQETRTLLDSMVGKKLTSITRHVLNDPDETVCTFEWLVGLDLRFGRSVLHVDVNPDDDTLVVTKARRQRSPDADVLVIDRASHPLWMPLMGQPLAFAWTMVNSRGYLDGLAFAFNTYAPSAMLIAAGSQIHEFSAYSRDRRVSEAAAHAAHEATQHRIDQAVDAFASDTVCITGKAAAIAATEALKEKHGRHEPTRRRKTARGSGAGLARSHTPAKDMRLLERVYEYIKNNPRQTIAQISRGIGITDSSKVRSAIGELEQRGDIRMSGIGGVLIASPARTRG